MANSIYDELNQYDQVNAVAKEIGVDPQLVHAVIHQESGGRADARSPKGAIGLMQMMPATAASPGFGVQPFDPTDPEQNLRGGVSYLKALLHHYGGDRDKALAAYNAGPGTVDRGGPLPAETRAYVPAVTSHAGPATGSIYDELDAMQPQAAPAAPAAKPAAQPGFVDNVISSGKQFGGNLLNAALHPLDTVDALAKTGAGFAQKVLPQSITSPWLKPGETATNYQPYADALIQHYKNRYGSVDSIKNTLYTDPVGAAADVATVAMPAGKLITGAGEIAGLGRVAQAGRLVSAVGDAVDPVNAVSKVLSKTVQPIAGAAAEHMANVNLQIPKALRRREWDQPMSPAQAVLETGRGTNPFSRFSSGGLANAERQGERLQAAKAGVLTEDVAKGNKYSLDPVDKAVGDYASDAMHDPNAQPKVAQINSVRDNLQNNPLYSKDKVVMVPVQKQVQVPHPFATGPNGQPVMQTQTITVMEPQVVGRELVPQDAAELERMKLNSDKGLNFGERGSAGDEARKVQRRSIDSILDQNVPGFDALNREHQTAEIARKTLKEAILSKETKRGMGLAEGMLGAAGALAGTGHPAAAAATTIPWLYNTVVKHPSLSSPIASALYGVSKASVPAAAALTPAANIKAATRDVGVVRAVGKDEALSAYQAYLASLQK
jgi:hypothetical protein